MFWVCRPVSCKACTLPKLSLKICKLVDSLVSCEYASCHGCLCNVLISDTAHVV